MSETTITALAAGSTPGGSEVLPADQAGATVKLTVDQIATRTLSLTAFPEAVDDRVNALLVAGTNITLTYNDGANTLTIDAAGGGGGTDLAYTAATRVLTSSTGADVTLPLVASADAGLAPASGGGTSNFLRADGTWAAPSGGSASLDGYVDGAWIAPWWGVVQAGSAFASNQIRLLPFRLDRTITVDGLGARCTTAVASSNCQMAIYASNNTTGRPTGNPLRNTSNISTATAAEVSEVGLTPFTLNAGTVYWAAIHSSAAIGFQTLSAATISPLSRIAGSTTLANVTSANTTTALHLLVSQTFGTWPDLTSGSFTESTSNSYGVVYLRVESLP